LLESLCCEAKETDVIERLNRKEAKILEVLTIATITINEGMKWRSKPAPGAPFGQFDAQNFPKL
jgi:hypothetical protein